MKLTEESVMNTIKSNIWVEKYRPQKLDDLVLDDIMRKDFESKIQEGGFPHYIFEGEPGMGKTTLARVLCNELHLEYYFINGAIDNKIDNLRFDLKGFAETMSFDGKKKCIIIDEIDSTNNLDFVRALKGFIELYANNVSFIFTCNNFDLISDSDVKEALRSRCQTYYFRINDKNSHYKQIAKKLMSILTNENIEINDEVKNNIKELIKYYHNDIRGMIQFLQQNKIRLSTKNLVYITTKGDVDIIFGHLKTGNFDDIRHFIINDYKGNLSHLFTTIYKNVKDYIISEDIPKMILITNTYMNQFPSAIDKEICIIAFLIDVVLNVKFK